MDNHKSIRLVSQLYIKQFRCFEERSFVFTAPIVLLEGANGSGKTSIVEALHFLCYVKSFRALSPRELIAHNQPAFFIKATLTADMMEDSIQAGFAGAQRLIKINDQPIKSYKELIDHYRVITITEHDIDLIQGGPGNRRQFIDLAMGVQIPSWALYLKKAMELHEQRSKALYAGSCTSELYEAWTETEWEYARMIQLQRIEYIGQLEGAIAKLVQAEFFVGAVPEIKLRYLPKISCLQDNYAQFVAANPDLSKEEIRLGRTLFGFHLDDIEIQFSGRVTRHYASRGQQKLTLLLLKAAQTTLLTPSKGPTLIILDDFVTDLDEQRIEQLLTLFMSLGTQLIITSPRADAILRKTLIQSNYQHQIITV